MEFSINSNTKIIKIEKTCMERYGVNNPIQDKNIFLKAQTNHKTKLSIKTYITKFGNSVHYQSIPELNLIEVCEENNIFIQNGQRLEYYLDNKKHFYYVDFETNNYIIEIKASHHWYKMALLSGEIYAKNKSAKEYANKNNKQFIFILDKDKNELINIMRGVSSATTLPK